MDREFLKIRRNRSSKIYGFLFSLLVVLLTPYLAFGDPDPSTLVTVEIATDKDLYQPGEIITIMVKVYLDGNPCLAKIDEAFIDISYSDGTVYRKHIEKELIQLSPGVFIAQGRAGEPGTREVCVRASVTYCCYSCGCCCQCTVWGVGLTTFSVEMPVCVCEPCCCPCCPC